jgi:hypothetical protein
MKAYLYRQQHHDCMIGGLSFSGFQCHTLELPWRKNEQEISCIPEGVYQCGLVPTKKWSPTPPLLYLLSGVPGRTDILIHAGNTTADSKGCILVGDAVTADKVGATFLRNSRRALTALHAATDGKPFTLTIRDQ